MLLAMSRSDTRRPRRRYLPPRLVRVLLESRRSHLAFTYALSHCSYHVHDAAGVCDLP